jgi:predicted DCC family thiol-disulfide oxidoreductase YuxK
VRASGADRSGWGFRRGSQVFATNNSYGAAPHCPAHEGYPLARPWVVPGDPREARPRGEETPIPDPSRDPMILFDGTCVMCSRLVRWIIEHESDHDLRFASLRSDAAVLALRRCGVGDIGVPDIDFETMYLIEDGRVYTRSDAVAYSARHLRWPWRALAVTTLVPRAARDAVYRFVARNRYRWFGTRTECAIPVPSVRQRFLD